MTFCALDVYELRDALDDLGIQTTREQAQKVMDKYDSDRNGNIDLGEFRSLYTDMMTYRGGVDDVEKAFKRYDTDGNRTLDIGELRDALEDLGIRTTREQARS